MAREHLVARLGATFGGIRGIGEGGFCVGRGIIVQRSQGNEVRATRFGLIGVKPNRTQSSNNLFIKFTKYPMLVAGSLQTWLQPKMA